MANFHNHTPYRPIKSMTIDEIVAEAAQLVNEIEIKADDIKDLLYEDPFEDAIQETYKMLDRAEINIILEKGRADTKIYLEIVSRRVEKECLEMMKVNARFGELTKIMAHVGAEISW